MSWMDSLKAAAAGQKKKVEPHERDNMASDIVLMASFGTAALTYAPVPLTDFVLVTPVQASMVMAIGRVYGRELSLDESKHIVVELASVCGLGLLAQKGFATLTKLLLPGLGGVLSGPYAFAVTYGMGRVAIQYFAHKDSSRAFLKGVYAEALREAKRLFSIEKLNDFRKRHGDAAEAVGKPTSPKKAGKASPRKRAAKRRAKPETGAGDSRDAS